MTRENGTLSLRKAINVLKCFDEEHDELSMTEIAQMMGLPTGTACRILNALLEEGLLERSERTRLYRLGLYCLRLGRLAGLSGVLRTHALPLMKVLRDRFNETVNLYVRKGHLRVCYAQCETLSPLRRTVPLGEKFPLWAGAVGRCILAWQPEDFVERILDEIVPLTENTIVDKSKVRELLRRVRADGYATSIAERELGVAAVAAPIFDAPGSVCASMSITGPLSRYTESSVQEMIPAIKEISRKLSEQLQK